MAAKRNKNNPSTPPITSTTPDVEKKQVAPSPEPIRSPEEERPLFLSNFQLLGLGGLLALLYFGFSFVSEGFYQHDEAAHFLSMRQFWHNPHSVLNNWAKPGFKLFYALPALMGETFVQFVNSLIAAASCVLVYKISEKLGSKKPLLAFVLLATQPFWVMLSFRNYSELLSALLLAGGLYAELCQKRKIAALLLSYIVLMRQEFYPILGLYFLYLVYKKDIVAAIMTGVFPLFHNVWGAISTGDALYLWNEIRETSNQIGEKYPRHGFEHYFKMSLTVYGGVALTLFMSYVSIKIIQKKQPDWRILVPTLSIFLMYCIFNIQSFPVGPSTAGNLRYLVFISPLVAVLGVLALDEYPQTPNAWKTLYILVPFVLIVGIFLTYQHNNVLLTEEKDNRPLLVVAITCILLLIPIAQNLKNWAMIGICVFMGILVIRPVPLSEEDTTCKKVGKWFLEYEKQFPNKQILANHRMVFYFMGRTEEDFSPVVMRLNEDNLQKVPKGSLIFWESHYSYRPELDKKSVRIATLSENPQQYKLVQEFYAKDRTFGLLVFEKL